VKKHYGVIVSQSLPMPAQILTRNGQFSTNVSKKTKKTKQKKQSL